MRLVDQRDPLTVHLTFWTDGPNGGDVPRLDETLILRHAEQDHGACYVVTSVAQHFGEGDVHGLTARFRPRSQAEIVADVARYGAVKPRPVVL